MTAQRPAVVFSRRATREVGRAVEWWRENRLYAPEAIIDDLNEVIDLLAFAPLMGAPANSRRLRDVRRVFLERVDYHLYYRFEPAKKQVTLLAFWHARRGHPPSL
jgi:plasmid stabilization system protein ParE